MNFVPDTRARKTDRCAFNCFVTQQDRATCLWCEAPWVIMFGGRVVLIQGKTRDHDVLMIDFNSFHDRLAGGQESHATVATVAYKRVTEKQNRAGVNTGGEAPKRKDKK